MRKLRIGILVITFGLILPSATARAQAQPISLHGTVNVLMASPQGIVVVTDSRLSSSKGTYPYEGQKLLSIGSNNYLTIAGEFYNSGLNFGGEESFRAAQLVPDMIKQWIERVPSSDKSSIDERATILAKAVAFGLEISAYMQRMSNADPGKMLTEISIAGYENGHPKIVQKLIQRNPADGTFLIKTKCSKDGSKQLEYCLGGIEDVAARTIENKGPTGDMIQRRWQHAVATNKGATFSLRDMRALALEMEELTAQSFPREVGGTKEIAVLTSRKTTELSNIVKPGLKAPEVTFSIDTNSTSRNPDSDGSHGYLSDLGFPRGKPTDQTAARLYVNANVVNGAQVLDRTIFTSSRFDHCVLIYYGSPLTYFDNNNTLNDTNELVIGPYAHESDPLVQQIKTAYPLIKIVHAQGAVIHGRGGEQVAPEPW